MSDTRTSTVLTGVRTRRQLIAARQGPAVERIGRVGEFWATRFAGGWSVYGWRSGLIEAGLSRDDAERWIGAYEAARTWQQEGSRA